MMNQQSGHDAPSGRNDSAGAMRMDFRMMILWGASCIGIYAGYGIGSQEQNMPYAFLALVVLIFIGLLGKLAVSDTQAIQKESERWQLGYKSVGDALKTIADRLEVSKIPYDVHDDLTTRILKEIARLKNAHKTYIQQRILEIADHLEVYPDENLNSDLRERILQEAARIREAKNNEYGA